MVMHEYGALALQRFARRRLFVTPDGEECDRDICLNEVGCGAHDCLQFAGRAYETHALLGVQRIGSGRGTWICDGRDRGRRHCAAED